MSEQNVQLVRQVLDAFNRRDRAAWLALCDPDLEIFPIREWPEIEAIRGREAAWDFYVEANEPWEESPYELVKLIEAGDDRVLVHLRREVRGRASGVDVTFDYWVVSTWRDGKFFRDRWFADEDAALKAAGLRE